MEVEDFERLLVARAQCERAMEKLNKCIDHKRMYVHEREAIAYALGRARFAAEGFLSRCEPDKGDLK